MVKPEQDISDNKAWSCSVLALWRGAGRAESSFSDVFRWWKTEEKVIGASSSNKRCFLLIWSFGVVVHLPAGRGGEGEMRCGAVTFRSGGLRGDLKLRVGADHMVALYCRHDLGLMRQPLRMPLMASIQPPRWRPSEGSLPAFEALSLPSGIVPGDGEGGRRWSPSSCSKEEGPDCIFSLQFRVLGVNCEDCVVISFSFRVLCVTCICTDSNRSSI